MIANNRFHQFTTIKLNFNDEIEKSCPPWVGTGPRPAKGVDWWPNFISCTTWRKHFLGVTIFLSADIAIQSMNFRNYFLIFWKKPHEIDWLTDESDVELDCWSVDYQSVISGCVFYKCCLFSLEVLFELAPEFIWRWPAAAAAYINVTLKSWINSNFSAIERVNKFRISPTFNTRYL